MEIKSKELESKMDLAFAISDFYQLLSLSLQYPSTLLADALANRNFEEDTKAILQELDCDSDVILSILNSFKKVEKNGQTLFRDMRQEYTRLFDHPKSPVLSIYESLFLYDYRKGNEKPRLFLNPVALDAERCYEQAGVGQINKSSEPADHLAVQLEFLSFLYASLGKGIEKENNNEIEIIEKQIRKFEDQHIRKWTNTFFGCLEAKTIIEPYRVIAQIAIAGLKQVIGK